MKKLTIIGSAIVLAGGSALAIAQQPGGGGGAGARGGFGGGMTFEALNTDTTVMRVGEGDNAAEMQVITRAEFDAFFASRGDGGRGEGGRGGFDPATQFDQWDANSDTYIIEEEFNNRPQGGRGGGGRGPGAEGGDSEE